LNNITPKSSSIDLSSLGSGIRDAISKSMSGFNLLQQPMNPSNHNSNQHRSHNATDHVTLSLHLRTDHASSSSQKSGKRNLLITTKKASSVRTLLPLSTSNENMSSLKPSSASQSNMQQQQQQQKNRPSYSRQSSGRRFVRPTRSSDQLIADMMLISVTDLTDPNDADNLVVSSLNDNIIPSEIQE
jgi:hypothetical protein